MAKRKLNFGIWGVGLYTAEFDEDMTCSQVVEQLIIDGKLRVEDGAQVMKVSGRVIDVSTLVKDIPEGMISFTPPEIKQGKKALFPIFYNNFPQKS
ncbi:MAG: hypothetical protein ACTSRA_00555 [Promethearchaeota archaeon]|nr:MAG: hypothetical protein [Helarchaeota virus Nidhogg Meg22_1012]URC17449.1 MAG: hypothetical protein [Helarchaeota virus Nidhogg Meg22_1214]